MDIEQILSALTPDIYQKFKAAIEIGKWPDGRLLTAEQKQICMQAVIAYEYENFEESKRTGFIERSECASVNSSKFSLKKSVEVSEEKVQWKTTDPQ